MPPTPHSEFRIPSSSSILPDPPTPRSEFRDPRSSNFAFLPPEFRINGESATRAEGHIMGDPRAAIVESVEQQKTRMRGHLAELDTLFACLQSRAFTGERGTGSGERGRRKAEGGRRRREVDE